ncbi:alginate export family protein [Bacteroidota bacterium]
MINLSKKFSLTVGRQILSYDNQRLISQRNWNQYGLSCDGVVLKHSGSDWSVDLGLSYNTMMNVSSGKPSFDNELFNQTNLIKTFNFLRLNRSIGEYLELSAIIIAAGYTNDNYPNAVFLTGTYGIYSMVSFDYFNLPIDFYYQNGKAQSARQVDAFAFGIKPTASFKTIEFGAGLDYLSVDDANSSDFNNKEKTFNKFHGSVYRFHG